MRLRSLFTVSFCLAVALSLIFATGVSAQGKKKDDTTRMSGRVQMISKDSSTITIQKDTMRMQIKYDANTQFTYRNKPGTIDEVKEGRRVICLVKKGEKGETLATRVDVREGK